MNCVIYTRVSSKEQEREGFSIPAQHKLLLEYVKEKKFTIVREFSDVETAKTKGRQNFGEMVEFLTANPTVKALLVEKLDRLYRNFHDCVKLEDLELEIHLVKERAILSKDSKSQAKLLHDIQLVLAKNYIDNLSEETKKGMREKAEQGEWPQKAPMGYINNKITHLVEPDPIKAPLIRRMFELYMTGKYSQARLRDLIATEGLVGAGGRRISKSMIDVILRNPFYYGEFNWGGKRTPGVHEPIITRGLFDSVQEMLNGRPHSRMRTRDFAFKGLLKCAKCGCSIVGEIKKGKYVYYHCTSAKGKCEQPYLREEVLDGVLADVVKSISITPNMVDEILSALRSSSNDEKSFREFELTRLRKRRDELQRRLDKAYEDRLDNVIDEAYWRGVSAKWRQEQDVVATRLAKLQEANREYVDSASEILELAKNAHLLYVMRTPAEKRQLLDSVLSNCTLDGLTVCPTYRKPFDLIAEGVSLQFMLPE